MEDTVRSWFFACEAMCTTAQKATTPAPFGGGDWAAEHLPFHSTKAGKKKKSTAKDRSVVGEGGDKRIPSFPFLSFPFQGKGGNSSDRGRGEAHFCTRGVREGIVTVSSGDAKLLRLAFCLFACSGGKGTNDVDVGNR